MDQVLKSLLSTTWGKNFIMWIFGAFIAAIAGLSIYVQKIEEQLSQKNLDLINAEKAFSQEKERLFRENIATYQNMLKRIETLEKMRKK